MITINLAKPHDYDHTHGDVQSGWLRAAVFGAMDGLASNTGLITGVAAAGVNPGVVILTGISGMIAGSISMALGEYTSVRTQNEQQDMEIRTEIDALERNPKGEQLELANQFVELGMTRETATTAAAEVHQNQEKAVRLHLANELGLSVDERPNPRIAAVSSFMAFAVGALVPILPYLLGFGTLIATLIFSAIGLIFAGAFAARITKSSLLAGAMRLLILGVIAVGLTYGIGKLLGTGAP